MLRARILNRHARASTSCGGTAEKDVDGRHTAGHDSGNALHIGE